jgi:glyoxylase-like metal-dependent hydrolase (beta-lactamase superfamily II)
VGNGRGGWIETGGGRPGSESATPVIDVGHSDTDDTSVLHVPDLDLVVVGDVVYNGVHQYLVESLDGGRDAWRRSIDVVDALGVGRIVAGHKHH